MAFFDFHFIAGVRELEPTTEAEDSACEDFSLLISGLTSAHPPNPLTSLFYISLQKHLCIFWNNLF